MPIPTAIDIPTHEQVAIVVDGQADEAAWSGAVVVDGFQTWEPVSGRPPTGTTTVRLLADRTHLYLHFEARDPQPDDIRAGLGRRDSRWSDDCVGVFLDPDGQAQRAYFFQITPLGVQSDGVRTAGNRDADPSWDGRWDGAARRTPTGYEAELAIPWKAFGHPARLDTIGLVLFREIARAGEKSSWPLIDQDREGLLVQEALVGGPGPVPPAAGLELMPELTFGWTSSGPASSRLAVAGVSPGLSARYGPVPGISFAGTINPDFSQVESDGFRLDVNNRYALRYEEKRPFFLEGQEWFEVGGGGTLLYTRSIVSPREGLRGTWQSGETTLSALQALDGSPAPSVSEGGGWSLDDLDGHPAAVTVLRLRHSTDGDGHVGVSFSDKHIVDTDLSNQLMGLDGRLRVSDRATIEGGLLTTQTELTDGDGTATLVGTGGAVDAAWATRHVRLDSRLDVVPPGVRSENGFLTVSDYIGGVTELRFTGYPDSSRFPSVSVEPGDVLYAWDTSGDLRDLYYDPSVWVRTGRGGFAKLDLHWERERFAGAWLEVRQAEIYLSGEPKAWLRGEVSVTGGEAAVYDPDAPQVGQGFSAWGALALQPASALELSFGLERAQLWSLAGDPLFRDQVFRTRLLALTSRTLWARVVADHDLASDARSLEGLVAWERRPGQALYLGGAGGWAEQSTWQVFAKASWVVGF